MSKQTGTINQLLEEALVPVENQPYKLPENWVWIKSEFAAKWGSGGTPSRKNSGYYNGSIPWLKTGELKDNIIFDSSEMITEEGLKKSSAKLFPRGSVAIAMYGATIGRLGILGIDAATNQACAVGYPYTLTNKNYMFYYLLSQRRKIIELGKGGAQPNISQAIIKKFPYALPPLNEQKRIAEKLDRLLGKVDEAKRLIDEAKETFEFRRAAILDKAFRGELTEKWREEKSLANSLEVVDLVNIQKIRVEKYEEECILAKKDKKKARYNKPVYFGEVKDEELKGIPLIPVEWMYSYLGNISEVVRGASPRPAGDPKYFGGNVPWITVAEITKDKEINLDNVSAYLTEEGAKRSRHIKEETLLLTNSGATLGVPKITKISGCINDGSVAFIELTNVCKKYLYYFLLTQTKRLRSLKVGAAQPNLNTGIVNHIIVPIPSLEEQREIVKGIELLLKRESKAGYYVNVDTLFNDLKQSILSKAFRGELGTNDFGEESGIELLKEVLQEQMR